MYGCKLSLEDIKKVCEIYIINNDLKLTNKQKENYIKKAEDQYINLIKQGSYIMGCFISPSRHLGGFVTVTKVCDFSPAFNKLMYIDNIIINKKWANKDEVLRVLLTTVRNCLEVEDCNYIDIKTNDNTVRDILDEVGLRRK